MPEEVKNENVTKNDDGSVTIKLSTGKVALIKQGKGKHARLAQRNIDKEQNPDSYMTALMASLVTIDDKAIVPEEMDELPLKDYMAIQTEFSLLNF
jgi:hypothetical protein